jgi:hypothetical protein
MNRIAYTLVLALAACGPQSADVAKARESVYQAEYATVWNAVQAEIDNRFADRIKIADGAGGTSRPSGRVSRPASSTWRVRAT